MNQIKVYINKFNDIVSFDIDNNYTINNIKKNIFNRFGIKINNQKIFLHNKELENNKKYKLTNDDILFCLIFE
jgi:hypothetical protein